MLGDNVVNFDTRGLCIGAKLHVVKLLMGPECHGGHDELHRGFWVVIHGVILAELRTYIMATIEDGERVPLI
jgi:hypothetical protein